MVNIVHQSGNSEKLDLILKAAQKRLGMYGYEKTTMTEIAADINMSKASLYYYFPDKESLLHAVLYKEQGDYFEIIAQFMKEMEDPVKMLHEFIRIRHKYFTTFMNLAKFRFSDFYQIKPHFKELIENLRKRETEMILEIFGKGVGKGIFRIDKPEETAQLFLEIIHSLRMIVVRNRPIQELNQEDFDLMYQKHRSFLELFIRGIHA